MLSDVGSLFGRGFLLGVAAPAAFFCALHVVAARAGVLPSELVAWCRGIAGGVDTAFLAGTAGVSLLLHTFTYGIIRSYEGYCRDVFFAGAVVLCGFGLAATGQMRWILLTCAAAVFVIALTHLAGARLEERRFDRDERALREAQLGGDKALSLPLEHHFTRNFPGEKSLVRPSKFGNIVRAAEYHPRAVYYIDPITMWTRLGAVVTKAYSERLDDSNAATVMWLNVSVLAVVLAVEALSIAYVTGPSSWFWTAAALTGWAYAAYRFACDAAHDWAEHIRGAFDLFRLDLLQQLGVAPATPGDITLHEERQLWVEVQRVTFYSRASNDSLRVRPRGAKPDQNDDAGEAGEQEPG